MSEYAHELGGVLTLAGNHCTVHGYHYPEPLRTVQHHIWPKEDGGPTVTENLVLVCDTGHYSIHALLDILRTNQPLPKSKGTRTERKLAYLGWKRIQDQKID